MLCVPIAINFLRNLGIERVQRYNMELARYGASIIQTALATQDVPGRFAARRPVALPNSLALNNTTALHLQRRIATELRTELSVTAPIGEERFGTIIVSAFVYNHPREYEQFAHSLPNLLMNG